MSSRGCLYQGSLALKLLIFLTGSSRLSISFRLAHFSKTSDCWLFLTADLTWITFGGKLGSGDWWLKEGTGLLLLVPLLWLSSCLVLRLFIALSTPWSLSSGGKLYTWEACCFRHCNDSCANAKFLSLLDTFSIPLHDWYLLKQGRILTSIILDACQHSVLVHSVSVGMKAILNIPANDCTSIWKFWTYKFEIASF